VRVVSDYPEVVERKAIVRFLVFRAARATIHRRELPWWAWLRRMRHSWTIVLSVVSAADIERGDQHSEQAEWLSEIEGGQLILEAIERAVAKRATPHINPPEAVA